jgi:hypothetical protein
MSGRRPDIDTEGLTIARYDNAGPKAWR